MDRFKTVTHIHTSGSREIWGWFTHIHSTGLNLLCSPLNVSFIWLWKAQAVMRWPSVVLKHFLTSVCPAPDCHIFISLCGTHMRFWETTGLLCPSYIWLKNKTRPGSAPTRTLTRLTPTEPSVGFKVHHWLFTYCLNVLKAAVHCLLGGTLTVFLQVSCCQL